MSVPSGWQEVSGEGHLDFGEWVNVNDLGLWVPHDSAKSQFIGTDLPRRIRFAGGIGFGGGGDTFPDSTSDKDEIWFWHWLEFEVETWFPMTGSTGFSHIFWKLAPGIDLWYNINM